MYMKSELTIGGYMKLLKLLCVFITCSCMIGCTSTSYERDTKQGEVINITLSQVEQKIKKKDSFSVMFTQSMCGYCHDFEGILNTYIESHHIIMYNVILDKEDTTPKENLAIIKQYFSDFSSTPGIYYVKDGKAESHLLPVKNQITEQNLDDWVVKNKIDKVIE